jgi:hypothetical protein
MIILARRIQIRREKIFWTTPWSSTGLLVKNIDMTSPVLAHGVAQNFFFSTDLNSTTQNYPKTIYLNLFRPAQVLSIKFEVQYWPRE